MSSSQELPSKSIVKNSTSSCHGECVAKNKVVILCTIIPIVVAILAALASFLFTRRILRRSLYDSATHSDLDDNLRPLKPITSNDQPDSVTTQTIRLPRFEPEADNDIRNKVAALCHAIDDHVQNFYDLKRDYGGGDTVESVNASDLLVNARTRKAIIRREIAMKMLNRICIDGDPETTFLPKQIVVLMHDIPSRRERPEYEHSAYYPALASWRVFTAFLLRLKDVEQGRFEAQDYEKQKQSNITNAVEELISYFKDFALPQKSKNQRNDLLKMMENSARVGLLLFRQPVTWGFGSWDSDDRLKSEDSMVTFPALQIFSDGDGRKIRSPNIVMEAEIEVIRGKAGQPGSRHGSFKARSRASTGSRGIRIG
ncbi:hypothetical protein BDD12DRAFT_810156 [Trichophaea hybrida]|nr:hypothetical protein BDD12DRAFT_810156 [Trichophaea hybrida]